MKNSSRNAPCSAWLWVCTSGRRWQMFGFSCCLLIATVAQASTSLFRASFEKKDGEWKIIRGSAAPDSRVLHGKNTSLRIERDAISQDACVRLTPVPLTLGKRYELSGWVRNRGAPGTRYRSLADCIGRRAHHGIHALRCPFGIARRHATMDALDIAICRQPCAGRDTAHGRAAAAHSVARPGSRAYNSTQSLPTTSGRFGRRLKPSVPLIAILPPVGSIYTSKASPSSADTNMAT